MSLAGNKDKKEEREETMQKLLDTHSDMSTKFAQLSCAEQMDFIDFCIDEMKAKGDPSRADKLRDYVLREKMIQEEAQNETRRMIQLKMLQQIAGMPVPISTDDGDQTPVYGDEVQKLKVMWADGMDWNPTNVGSSSWLICLAAGDYNEMMKMVQMTPDSEIKALVEKRETLCNVSAIFHVIKGAMMMDVSGTKFHESVTFVDHLKAPTHIKCLLKLIELGANVNARDFAGCSPLFLCVTKYGNPTTLKMAKILLKNGADVNARNRMGETALVQPVMSKKLDAIKLLLDYGANPTIKDNVGISVESMNVWDRDLMKLFANAGKNKSKKMRAAAKEADGILRCAVCGEESRSRCTGCYITRYCGKECQIADWKNHKKQCDELKQRFVPVNLLNGHENIINISRSQGGKVTAMTESLKAPKVNFLVKIQVPYVNPTASILHSSENLDAFLMVYDETRSIYGSISCTEPAYAPLCQKIRAEGVYGAKGYFYALCDKNGKIRINIEDIQPPKPW